jgi:predicted proteasome-type protease
MSVLAAPEGAHTVQGVAEALERLRRRDPESMTTFIGSLAQGSGLVGEQVRTFIGRDDVAETLLPDDGGVVLVVAGLL